MYYRVLILLVGLILCSDVGGDLMKDWQIHVNLEDNPELGSNTTEEELSSRAEELQPLKLPVNMNLKNVMKKLSAQSGRKIFFQGLLSKNSSDVMPMDSFFSKLSKLSKLLQSKYENACKTNSTDAVTPQGQQKCFEKCVEENDNFIYLFNHGFQKTMKQLPGTEKIKVRIEATYSNKISKCRLMKDKKYSCYCRPEYIFSVNSYFQGIVDDLVGDHKLTTRGLIGFIATTIYDIVAFILFAIFHPIRAFKFVIRFFFFGIPEMIRRAFYRITHPYSSYYHAGGYPQFQTNYNNPYYRPYNRF